MQGGQKPKRTRIWQAWRRSNLTLNEIGYLLGKQSDAELSRYQTGRLPNLQTALMLEIILGTSIHSLFREEFEELSHRIRTRAEKRRGLQNKLNDAMANAICSFADLLDNKPISQETRMKIHRHCASLINQLNLSEQPKREETNE